MAKEGNIYCVYTMCLFLPDNVLEFWNMPHKKSLSDINLILINY